MRWSFRIGSIAGIRVELHVTFLLFVGWVAVSQGALTGNLSQAISSVTLMLAIFGCVLIHELGHAFAARRYGIRTRDIVLLPIGGLARLQRMPDKPQQEVVVALAGPAVNVAIAAMLWGVLGRVPDPARLDDSLLPTLFWVNTVMATFNLVPAFPMDGGRVLRALLALRLSYTRATRIAAGVGQAIALLFGVAGFFILHNPMLMFVALFVFLAAGEEYALVRARASMTGFPVRAAMITEFDTLEAGDPLQRAVDLLVSGNQQDFPVLEGGVPVGILSRNDLLVGLQRAGPNASVGSMVNREGRFAEANEPLEDAFQRMREHRHPALPVLSGGRLVGLVTTDNVSELLLVQDALRRHGGR